ncbi:MAG: PAS domain S-box protein [Thermodesulfobacteriota bacterium]
MKSIAIDAKPTLIVCAKNSELENSTVKLIESTGFTSVFISNYIDLLADIEKKNAHTLIIEFADYIEENFEFIIEIKSIYPHIDIIVIYSFSVEDEKLKNFRIKILKLGVTDCIHFPSEINFLEIRIKNSFNRQSSILELNTNIYFWNSINKSLKSIISDLNSSAFYKKVVKQAIRLTKSDFGSILMLKDGKINYVYSYDGNDWNENSDPEIEFSENIYNLQLDDNFIIFDEEELKIQSKFPFTFRESKISAYMNFPIYSKNKKLIGILETYKASSKYDDSTRPLMVKIILETLPFEKNKPGDEIPKADKQKNKELKIIHDDNYLSVVDNAPITIFIVLNDIISFVNKTACDLLGYTKKDLLNTNFANICSNKMINNLSQDTDPKLNKTGLVNLYLKKKDDDSLPLRGSMKFINYMNQNALLITGIEPIEKTKKDIADDTSGEILRLAAAVNSLRSAVTITDMDRKIIYVNPAHKNTFGYDSNELIGSQSNVLFSIDDPSGISDKIYDAIVTVGWEGERISVRKNGEVFPSYEKISVVKDKKNNPIGIVSIIDEITQRKRLQQALKESEERYRTLVETASTAIIAMDNKGEVILYNPSAELIFNFKKDDLSQIDFSSLIKEIDSPVFDPESGSSKIDKYIGMTVELRGINKDGDEFPIEITFSKCKIEGVDIYTAIILDITERKNLQNQLIQSAKLAAVGELISGVTHEVNNPLAVVMGYAEMMISESNMDEETLKSVKVIYNESERARKVIQNMLSFARQHAPEKEPVIINDVINTTLDLAEFDLKKHGIKIIKEFDEKIPAILGESNQLEQVFLNLFINAQHAISENNKKGTITIKTISQKDINNDQNGHGYVNVIVSDDGPGIPQKIINNIFDPFFTTKPEGKGTGLGLSVSLGIIKDHNGIIEVISKKEKGTSFDIKFPILYNS